MTIAMKPIDPTKRILKVVIAGSRVLAEREPEILDYLSRALAEPMQRFNVVIVNGMAKGPDTIGGKFAELHGLPQIFMPAQWDDLGRFAGHLRNQDMAIEGHAVYLLWTGDSNGSRSMLNFGLLYGLRVTEVLMSATKGSSVDVTLMSEGLNLWM